MNPLSFTAREGARLPFERQVRQPDFVQITDTVAQLAQQITGARLDVGAFSQRPNPFREIAHRNPSDRGDRLAVDEYVERIILELGPLAGGAGHEAPVSRQQNPDVSLVPSAFEPVEKAAHSRPAFVPFLALLARFTVE